MAIDFGRFGSSSFPGDALALWGAVLVEPPDVQALRQRVERRLVKLGDLAIPRSGIPTRAVRYFCVQEITDSQELRDAGIVTNRDRQRTALVMDGEQRRHRIDRDSLLPLVRQPRNVEGRIRLDDQTVGDWRLFSVQESRDALLETGRADTLQYIAYGEEHDYAPPQRSRRLGGTPSMRAQIAVRRQWWSVPVMPTGAGRIIWPKGRGNHHYVSILPEGVVVPDNFYYSQPPAGLHEPLLLGAVANLSWAHLMCEIFGRRAAGDGVLHTYIRELAQIPIIDPRQFDEGWTDRLLEAFEPVASRAVFPIDEELRQSDRWRFDLTGMAYLVGEDEAEEAVLTVHRALRLLAHERAVKAAVGRTLSQRARHRGAFDPQPIAALARRNVGDPPDPLARLPQHATLDTVTALVPDHSAALSVDTDATLFGGFTSVVVDGTPLLEAPTAEHALLIVDVLRAQPDFEGTLVLPRAARDAEVLSDRYRADLRGWMEAVDREVRTLIPEASRAARRSAVKAALFAGTGRIGLA